MDTEVLLARIAENPHLPTLPAVTLQVIDKVSHPDCTIAEIGTILQQDAALCGRVLKLVNSALFSMPRAITSIRQALALLGLKRVRSLVLSLSLPAMRGRQTSDPWMRTYWENSVSAATLARELALRIKAPDPDNELVAGLLCDLGMLILHQVVPEEYGRIHSPGSRVGEELCVREREAFGVDHAEVGAYVLRHWRLPEELTEAVRWHHNPSGAGPLVAARARLLYLASATAWLDGTGGDAGQWREILRVARQDFGLDEANFLEFLKPLGDKIDELAKLLQVETGAGQPNTNLLARATEQLTRLAVEANLDNLRLQQEKDLAEQERRQAEETLGRTEEMLRQAQKMEAVGRLASGVAHEFNNLLTIVMGFSEMLMATLPQQSSARGLAEQIRAAGERASALTRQLLTFSRQQVIVPVVLNLNEVIANLGKMIHRLIGEDIEFAHCLEPKLPLVYADPGHIEQVLINLAVNARDAMPRGGKLTVRTQNVMLDQAHVLAYPGCEPGPYVLLSVSDNGCGMDEQTKARIFEPFFTTKGPGRGTGLGLAIVYGIVHQNRGHIHVSSEVGRGTTFWIYLPPAREMPAPKEAPPPAPTHVRGTETVLLAEDEEGVRRLARHILEESGYRVLEAHDGRQALALAKQHSGPLHLLLTDTVMPNMGGRQLAEGLETMRPGIKVLYMSGYTDEVVLQNGVSEAKGRFLCKPFTPEQLARKVREVLDRAHPGGSVCRAKPG